MTHGQLIKELMTVNLYVHIKILHLTMDIIRQNFACFKGFIVDIWLLWHSKSVPNFRSISNENFDKSLFMHSQ